MRERVYRNIMNLLIGICLLLTPLALWTGIHTGMFISQAELSIDGRTVYFKRFTPFGAVYARWHSEIHVLDGTNYECNSGGWQYANYQRVKSNAVTYTIGDWADPCIDRGSNYTITTTRQAFIMGIPIRPQTVVDLVKVE